MSEEPWEGGTNDEGDEELRISSEDGMAYSKLEFIAYFGDTTEWDKSEIVHVVLDHNASEEEEAAAKAAAIVLDAEAATSAAEASTAETQARKAVERKAHAEEVRRVAEVIAKKDAEKKKREQLEREEQEEVEKAALAERQKAQVQLDAEDAKLLAEELGEANRIHKEQQEKSRLEQLAQLAETRKIEAAEEAAIAKSKADERVDKQVERAKRKADEAEKAARAAERAANRAAKAKVSAREAKIVERNAKKHAGMQVEDEATFQANLAAQEIKEHKEQEAKQAEEVLLLKQKLSEKSTKEPETLANEVVQDETVDPLPSKTHPTQCPTTPQQYKSTKPVPAFLSPRDATHVHPDLPKYGVEHDIMNQEISEHEIEAGLTLRDIARQMEAERSIEVEIQNLQLQHQIRNCPPHYDSKKFEESYKLLMREQAVFKESLCWDKDPENRSMPVSPRITSYYNPRINDSRKIPQKPVSFGSNAATTPNSAHRKLKKRGGAYKYVRKKKSKPLSAKTMLDAFVKSRKSIPPQEVNDGNPIRDNNQPLRIVVETRSKKGGKSKTKKKAGGTSKRDEERSAGKVSK